MSDMLINIIVGIGTGVISSILVTIYYRDRDKDRELKIGLYELHMYLSVLRTLLEDGAIEKLKEVLIFEPSPLFLKIEDLPLTDETKRAIIDANKVIGDLRDKVIEKKEVMSETEIIQIRISLTKASFRLLKAKQTH